MWDGGRQLGRDVVEGPEGSANAEAREGGLDSGGARRRFKSSVIIRAIARGGRHCDSDGSGWFRAIGSELIDVTND